MATARSGQTASVRRRAIGPTALLHPWKAAVTRPLSRSIRGSTPASSCVLRDTRHWAWAGEANVPRHLTTRRQHADDKERHEPSYCSRSGRARRADSLLRHPWDRDCGRRGGWSCSCRRVLAWLGRAGLLAWPHRCYGRSVCHRSGAGSYRRQLRWWHPGQLDDGGRPSGADLVQPRARACQPPHHARGGLACEHRASLPVSGRARHTRVRPRELPPPDAYECPV